MWLLPLFPRIARATAAVYYRIRYLGPTVPPEGPVLLVANHPNSLLDSVMVVATARRPVRFLAKAPLFTDRKVGWLMRGGGAIPVYRRQDDPSQMGRNDEMFAAVHQALADGSVVGLFPEGISHNEPSIAPLKTGAARIALGASLSAGLGSFPIVPVGLTLRGKDRFRSEAQAMVGQPVSWDDLADRGADDSEAVNDLTERISIALRELTLNLDSWHDQPLVETAVRIWEQGHADGSTPEERSLRLSATTRILEEIRRQSDPEGLAVIRDVGTHRLRLVRLGLRPSDLAADIGLGRGLGWLVRRVPLVMPLAAVVGFAGWLLFFVPYRLTALIMSRFELDTDVRSTWQLMIGMLLYSLWWVALVLLAFTRSGAISGLLIAVGVPALGMAGLMVRERWRGSWQDARRYLVLRSRRSLMKLLLATQEDLGQRLDQLVHRFTPGAVE